MSGSGCVRTGNSGSERVGVGDERVGAQRDLERLVVCGHQRARVLGAERLPPQARDPLGVGVLDGGLLGRGVAERREQRVGSLARGAAQHRVDEPVAGAGVRLGELDGVADDGVVGRAAHVQQLVEAEPQRGEQRRVERRHGTLGELLDEVVERALALDGAVGEAHREARGRAGRARRPRR